MSKTTKFKTLLDYFINFNYPTTSIIDLINKYKEFPDEEEYIINRETFIILSDKEVNQIEQEYSDNIMFELQDAIKNDIENNSFYCDIILKMFDEYMKWDIYSLDNWNNIEEIRDLERLFSNGEFIIYKK